MNYKTIHRRGILRKASLNGLLVLGLIFASAPQHTATAQSKLGAVPEFHPELGLSALEGYLGHKAIPNSLALIPPPPAPGSTAQKLDEEVARNTFALRGTPRFERAASDYDLRIPHLVNTFSCALNATITKENAPYLYMVLSRAFSDLGMSTYAAKNHYGRTRPFQQNHAPLAVPEAEAFLSKDPSYPSGHTAIGWGLSLILSELAPDRANEILARGRAFGESRIVCNHHWRSDVEWGMVMGAATVARLHADATFRADMELARAEFAALRAKGVASTNDCNAEASALAYGFQESNMTAIDILLDPDATMLKQAEAVNARLRKVFPQGFALDATHKPHITLVQAFVRTTALDSAYAAAGKVLAAAQVTAMKLKAFKYYYIPSGANGLSGIVVEPTPALSKLQMDLLAAIAPFTTPTGTTAAFYTTPEAPVIVTGLIPYVQSFATSSAGDKFNPHVTTGVAPKDYLDKMLTEKFKVFTFSPAGASVYQLGDYGTAAKKLKDLAVKP